MRDGAANIPNSKSGKSGVRLGCTGIVCHKCEKYSPPLPLSQRDGYCEEIPPSHHVELPAENVRNSEQGTNVATSQNCHGNRLCRAKNSEVNCQNKDDELPKLDCAGQFAKPRKRVKLLAAQHVSGHAKLEVLEAHIRMRF
jgi:hypothetical protein